MVRGETMSADPAGDFLYVMLKNCFIMGIVDGFE